MNLPAVVESRHLAALASPDDTFAVRVVVRRVMNQSAYLLRGKLRSYSAQFLSSLGAHVLDVPLSVWMKGFPKGTYAENPSIAHDLQGNRSVSAAPLVFLIISWGEDRQNAAPEAAERDVAPLLALRDLAAELDAPDIILSAIDLVASDRPAGDIVAALAVTVANVREQNKETEPSPSSEPVHTPQQGEQSAPPANTRDKAPAKSAKQISDAALRMRKSRERKKAREAAKQTADAANATTV